MAYDLLSVDQLVVLCPVSLHITPAERVYGMDVGPRSAWKDGDTFLNSSDDRAGMILIGVFATILGFYIIPEALRYFRSR